MIFFLALWITSIQTNPYDQTTPMILENETYIEEEIPIL